MCSSYKRIYEYKIVGKLEANLEQGLFTGKNIEIYEVI